MPLMSLPNELLDNVVDKLVRISASSVKDLALVSRYFLHRCRYHLLHTIRVSGGSSSVKEVKRKFKANPALFKYPRNLSITKCFDFLLYDEFALDPGKRGFLRMVEQLDNLRNLDIVDEEHPDSVPHWNELAAVLQSVYHQLLAHPLIHLSICLPKGFPDHLISSISTLQELNIDDVTESSVGAGSLADAGSSNLHWGLKTLQYCHRGTHPTALLQNTPSSLLVNLTRLTLDITNVEGHVFAWSKLLAVCKSRLLSLNLRYTGPTSRYPGGRNQNIVSAALKDATSHTRSFPSFPRLLHLRVELHSYNDNRDPPQDVAFPFAMPRFYALFLQPILGGQSVRRSLMTLDLNLNWVTSTRVDISRWPSRIVQDHGWVQVDDPLSSEELFPSLVAVRLHTAVRIQGRELFMSYDDRTPKMSAGLRNQAAAMLEKTSGRLRVLDVGDETTHVRFNEIARSR